MKDTFNIMALGCKRNLICLKIFFFSIRMRSHSVAACLLTQYILCGHSTAAFKEHCFLDLMRARPQ